MLLVILKKKRLLILNAKLKFYLPNDLTTALRVGRSRDRFPVVSLGIFFVATDRTMRTGVESASENEYQGFLLG